jgi:hypothetical protein
MTSYLESSMIPQDISYMISKFLNSRTLNLLSTFKNPIFSKQDSYAFKNIFGRFHLQCLKNDKKAFDKDYTKDSQYFTVPMDITDSFYAKIR